VDNREAQRTVSLAPPAWHALTVPETLARLESRPAGLTSTEAAKRLQEYGPNLLTPPKPRSPIIRFLLQFHDILIYILLVSGIVKLFLGDLVAASVIFGVIVINAIIGFVQEGKAERALAAIRGMLSLNATVVRDGQRRVIPADQLVPGDVVFLQSGDKVPADLRLIAVKSLQIQEAAFTGESVAVEKSVDPVEVAAVPGDRSCMAFSGTLVTYGQGTGMVVATGDQTEIGRIGTMLGEVTAVTTPLLQQVAAFSKILAILIVGVAAGIFAIGWLVHGQDPNEMFSAAIALAVAAIPEGLPAVMTITLAIGVQRMAKRNAIIRRLPAVETLGSVSVICSDKTGTLTRNEMMVETIVGLGQTFTVTGEGYAPRGYVCLNDEPVGDRFAAYFDILATAALLCNDAVVRQREDGTYIVEGDPMEGALSVLALKLGLKPVLLAELFPRTDVIPFESEHQFMATLHHDHTGAAFAMVKGAPERILARCISQFTLDGEEPLDLGYWQDQMAAISARGQRVLALARKAFDAGKLELTFGDVESGLTLIGLVGLADPPSSDALAAVAECREAGIRVKMITGDHAGTARAIAEQFNLENCRDVLTGVDLDQLDDAALADRAVDIDVFARTTPQHKLRLVEALQRKGKIVAMTGDGVNDAPALKKADIGIAMGRRGTEAAKEAAQMVLADDNFASIAHAVEEGRTVYDNLKKAILFLLATNLAQALTILVAVIAGLSLPITAVQILWVNMVVAVTLGLALAFEPTESNVMHRPPRPRSEPLVTPLMLWRIIFIATISLIGVFGIYDWKLETTGDVPLARTAAVNMLVGCAAFYLLSARKTLDPLLAWASFKGFRPALISFATIVALQLAFTYLPPMQAVFGTVAIGLDIWGEIVAFGVLLCTAAEVEKAIVRWRMR
jgi:magnesium-transporting ATPase (P-type)